MATSDVVFSSPDFSMKVVAGMLVVTRQTVGRWVGGITERRKLVRKVRAVLLSRLGWSNVSIADHLGVTEGSIGNDVNGDIYESHRRPPPRSLDGLPGENGEIAEALREELTFASWTDEERELLKRLRFGETVVINMRDEGHLNLRAWAEEAGLFELRVHQRSALPSELSKVFR